MSDGHVDGLWPHFAPLWTDLRGVTSAVFLAGGYGLFLKQRWLVSQVVTFSTDRGLLLVTENSDRLLVKEVPTLVEISRWIDGTPRVTKDFDLLVGLDLIASVSDQRQVEQTLKKHAFAVVPGNERWQFQKNLTDTQNVMLDFHALAPAEN